MGPEGMAVDPPATSTAAETRYAHLSRTGNNIVFTSQYRLASLNNFTDQCVFLSLTNCFTVYCLKGHYTVKQFINIINDQVK
jgi:hypothetical protein